MMFIKVHAEDTVLFAGAKQAYEWKWPPNNSVKHLLHYVLGNLSE
jgi:hypothetical protein